MRTVLRSPNTTWALAVLVGLVVVFAVIADGSPVAARQGEDTSVGDPGAGERTFRADCAMCHGGDAAGMMRMHPSLRGAITRLSREGVEVTIRQGRRTQPPMPAFQDQLSQEEIDDVVAFIASLPEGPRNFGPGEDGGMMMGDGVDAGDIAIVVLAVLATVGLALGGWAIFRTRSSPRRVLDRRYATGELSREDYLQHRRDLNLD